MMSQGYFLAPAVVTGTVVAILSQGISWRLGFGESHCCRICCHISLDSDGARRKFHHASGPRDGTKGVGSSATRSNIHCIIHFVGRTTTATTAIHRFVARVHLAAFPTRIIFSVFLYFCPANPFVVARANNTRKSLVRFVVGRNREIHDRKNGRKEVDISIGLLIDREREVRRMRR
jgi:hypothetical protein